ncbi:MAG: cysteine hydrolase [Desulfobacteraceae bacterium]|nr:MAG: cysteine hydrolase [Desulfobacteraceae bacterium]
MSRLNNISIASRSNRVYECTPEHTALVVIDLQKEFFEAGSGQSLDDMRAMVPRAQALIELSRQAGFRIIHTRESYQPDLSDVNDFRRSLGYVGRKEALGRFCILGEPGHEFMDAVRPMPGETIIDKAGFSAFYNTTLDQGLRSEGIDHLILCGVTTQCCVHSTLREAVDRGYWCLTVADCCAACEPGLHDAALSLISGEGHLFGWVADLKGVEDGVSQYLKLRTFQG